MTLALSHVCPAAIAAVLARSGQWTRARRKADDERLSCEPRDLTRTV